MSSSITYEILIFFYIYIFFLHYSKCFKQCKDMKKKILKLFSRVLRAEAHLSQCSCVVVVYRLNNNNY